MFREGNIDGPKGETKKMSVPTEETKSLLTEKELNERYEVTYRNTVARDIWRERTNNRKLSNDRRDSLLKSLSAEKDFYEKDKEDAADTLQRKSKEIQLQLDQIDEYQKKQKIFFDQPIKQRSLLQKIFFRVKPDQDTLKKQYFKQIEETKKSREMLSAEMSQLKIDNNARLDSIHTHRQRNEKYLQSDLTELETDISYQKKALLDKVHDLNQSSKLVVKNVFDAMLHGEHDITKLAVENNAIVVHAIPLDGWNMKNTSMNNRVVDIESMSAQEKVSLLVDKRPDISASVIGVDAKISGQEMFYPFGYILDGTMIAAYDGDEGTYASGDVRRRKEAYHRTLQEGVANTFEKISKVPAKSSQGGQYNEAIIHKPDVKGVIIDETVLLNRPDLGDSNQNEQSKLFNLSSDVEREEFYSLSREIPKQFNPKIAEGFIPIDSGNRNAGKYMGKISYRRDAMTKALDFAKEQNPGIPVYVRKQDGIYNLDGKKVTAKDIYL